MGQPAFSLNVHFESLTCADCGLPFAAPSGFFSSRRNDHKTFYCPVGHSNFFPAESDTERLRKLLAAEQDRKLAALARANEAEEARAKLERKLKRVHKGICPQCNRTFPNLAQHMACKHSPKKTSTP